MGGIFVPYLDAHHGGEYSPEIRRESFAANCKYPNVSGKTVTAKQPRNGEPSSRFLQPPDAGGRRITTSTIKTSETEECWSLGEFISTNYGDTDDREPPPKIKKRKCQIVQYSQHGSAENISESGEVARPVKISRPPKPKLITIPRSSPCRDASSDTSEANDFAQEFIMFEQLSSISNSLSFSSCGGQSSSFCDDSGYATQDSYGSTSDTSPFSPNGRPAHASPSLLRRFSFKTQIPRWIQKNSSLHKNESSFRRTEEINSSLCSPTSPELPLPSPESPSEDKKTLMATCWTVGWTLDHLEASIMQSPWPNLTLFSPVIIYMRSTTEKTLIHPFQEIFPSAPIEKLSSLCAAFVAQIYLSSLETYEHIISGTAVDGISGKARTRLGLHLSKASQLRVKERLLRTRGAYINARLDKIVDMLLVDLCGTSDTSLKEALVALVQTLEGNKSSSSSGH